MFYFKEFSRESLIKEKIDLSIFLFQNDSDLLREIGFSERNINR